MDVKPDPAAPKPQVLTVVVDAVTSPDDDKKKRKRTKMTMDGFDEADDDWFTAPRGTAGSLLSGAGRKSGGSTKKTSGSASSAASTSTTTPQESRGTQCCPLEGTLTSSPEVCLF
jgi:hypothetical protein